MEFNEIKEIMELFSKSDIDRLKLEVEGFNLTLGKKKTVVAPVAQEAGQVPVVVTQAVPAGDTSAEAMEDDSFTYVESPIVGTFYRAPNPSADPFVKVGSTVSKGQTLCIVEAMKLMNEIQAEEDGVIAKILVENGEGIEFGQKLFAIKPH